MKSDFLQVLVKHIALLTKLPINEIKLEIPPRPEHGDYAFGCFALSRVLKKGPQAIAQDLAKTFPPLDIVEKVEAEGPYLNITIKTEAKAKRIVTTVDKDGPYFGNDKKKKGPALIEHTSINPNASPHVGRARNAIIGDSVKRLLKHSGYDIEVHYFVNDTGKQIALLVLGLEEHPKATFSELLDIYVKINTKAKEDPSIEKKAFDILAKLEAGDKPAIDKFKKTVSISLKGQVDIFKEFGIEYDFFDFESQYLAQKKVKDVLEKLKASGKLFIDEHNRQVLDLKGFNVPMEPPVLVLTRADGTSLYPLRDIAYTLDKIKKCPEKNIIILGEAQKLYFQQVSAALAILGSAAPIILSHAYVGLPEGKFSTRDGNVVLLEDFMKTAREKALDEIKTRGILTENEEKVAKQVAYGAIKFSFLRISADKQVTFRWEEALSFDGESGPYIQYTYARINSLLSKNKEFESAKPDFTLMTTKQEFALLRKLSDYEASLKTAMTELKPHILAQALYQLAKSFNEFYQNCPIMGLNDKGLSSARYQMSSVTKSVVGAGLLLLGIEAPEKM